jgi:hypothetical protein
MLYAIAIGAFVLTACCLWGIRKMLRMDDDPDQLALARLLVSAGNGEDDALLAFLEEQRWTDLHILRRAAHALALAEELFLSDEHLRAKEYANTLLDRLRSYRTDRRGNLNSGGIGRKDASPGDQPLITPSPNNSPVAHPHRPAAYSD